MVSSKSERLFSRPAIAWGTFGRKKLNFAASRLLEDKLELQRMYIMMSVSVTHDFLYHFCGDLLIEAIGFVDQSQPFSPMCSIRLQCFTWEGAAKFLTRSGASSSLPIAKSM